MSNVYQIQSNEQRQDEASEWIAKLDRELTESEVSELQQWMAADPKNEELLTQMTEIDAN